MFGGLDNKFPGSLVPGTGSNRFEGSRNRYQCLEVWIGSQVPWFQEPVPIGSKVWIGSQVPWLQEPVPIGFKVWIGSQVPGTGINVWRFG